MTKQELNQHRTLLQRLEKNRKLLEFLEVAGLADEVSGIRDDIARLNAEVQQSEAAVTAWFNTIEDLPTRMIFRLRFLRGLEWKTVAALIGGGNTKASVEKHVARYLEAHHDE